MLDSSFGDRPSDHCLLASGQPLTGTGQELPGNAGSIERLTLLGLYRRELIGNAGAMMKSAEILLGGARVFNAAAYALTLTALDDAFALHRARRSCRSTAALVAVERDHAVRAAGEGVRRLALMARIGREVGEEATYPLRIRLELLLENLPRVALL